MEAAILGHNEADSQYINCQKCWPLNLPTRHGDFPVRKLADVRTNIPFIFHSYSIHIPFIFHSYSIHIPFIFHSYSIHIPFIFHSYPIIHSLIYHQNHHFYSWYKPFPKWVVYQSSGGPRRVHQRRALHMPNAQSCGVSSGHWGTQTHLKVEAKQNNLSQIWYDKVIKYHF